MNDILQKDVKNYVKEIRLLLFCDSKTKRSFLNDFKNDVANFADDNGITDMKDIIDHFGTPEQVAREFLGTADLRKIRKRMQFKKYILCGVIAALLSWLIMLTYLAYEEKNQINGYFVTNPPVIEESWTNT